MHVFLDETCRVCIVLMEFIDVSVNLKIDSTLPEQTDNIPTKKLKGICLDKDTWIVMQFLFN